ncbi:MAG: NfeD family protein [Gemmatimonadota bacterium]
MSRTCRTAFHQSCRAAALLLVAVVLAAAARQAAPGAVWRIPLTGVVELGLAPFIERTLGEAEAAGAAAVILHIETPGGRVDAAWRIVDAVKNAEVPVYAFVDRRALSAGALIALATDRIYMRPGGTMGAATPVTGDGVKASEKMVSAMRSEMRALAEERGLDPLVAEAMVDESIAVEGLAAEGKLLTLSTEQAAAVGYAEPMESWDALVASLGLADAPLHEARLNWAEKLVRFFTNPMVAPLLLSLGFLGLMVEIKAPGLGLPGGVGATSLALFFGSHLLLGLAGLEEILLLLAGVGLIAVEVFLIPGFGIAGIAGILAVVASIFFSLVGPMATAADLITAASVVSLSALVVILAGWALVRRLPRSGRFSSSGLLLGESTRSDTGYTSFAIRGDLVGAEGVTLTDLRPAGAARFGDERIDVVAEANWIESGTPVRIVRSEGYRHVVVPHVAAPSE